MLHSNGMRITRSHGRAVGGLLLLAALSLLGPRPKALAEPPPEAALHGAQLLDSIAAIVGRRIVTLSQLRFEARIALANHESIEAAQGPLDREILASTLDYVVNEDLVEEEASRLQVFQISPDETNRAERELARRFPSSKDFEHFLRRFHIRHERVQAILRRGLRVARYLANRLTLQSQASDAEVSERLSQHPDEARGAEARSLAKADLQRQKYQLLVTALVRELRTRSNVRLLADFSGSEPGAGAYVPAARLLGALPSPPVGPTAAGTEGAE